MTNLKNKDIVAIGTGKRKSAIAQVFFVRGTGECLINDIPISKYMYINPASYLHIQNPLDLLGLKQKFRTEMDIIIKVMGGGKTGQAEAIRLGVSRAIYQLNPIYRVPLKMHKFLTRDARCKERKKYGLKKARKAPQFSKR